MSFSPSLKSATATLHGRNDEIAAIMPLAGIQDLRDCYTQSTRISFLPMQSYLIMVDVTFFISLHEMRQCNASPWSRGLEARHLDIASADNGA